MTDEEHDIFVLLMRQIRDELQKRPDELQNAIIVGYIELMLNFCQRFYNRQFITRKLENSDILMKFDSLLRDYYEEKTQLDARHPDRTILRRQTLHVSQLFQADMIKKTTGDTASNYFVNMLSNGRKATLQPGQSIAQDAGQDSDSNIPSISAGCSKDRKDSPRKNIAKDFGKDPGQRTRRIATPE